MIMKQSKICHFLAFLKDIYESPCAAIESIRLSIGQPEQSQTGKRLWQENLIVIWYSNLPQSPKSLLQFRSLPASWVLLLQGGGKQHSKHPAFHLVGSTLVAVSARVGRHSRSWRWCFFLCWSALYIVVIFFIFLSLKGWVEWKVLLWRCLFWAEGVL